MTHTRRKKDFFMLPLPPMPSWDAIHPLIIHFPIVLLLLAPFLVLVGALRPPEQGRTILYVALAVMIAGTVGTHLAVASGEAAAQLAERTPQVDAVLEHHEHLAEATRIGFSVLTVIFAAILFIPRTLRKTANRLVSTVLPLAFLILYGGGTLLLVNTAHNGARLVHEFGVTAALKSSPVPAAEQERNPQNNVPGSQKDTAADRD
ncbi:MAG TPA: DUF2231 domain-containing protein [Terriglobales bacterium]|nr:DUF2231 domain-containing protein [Terriglobales bacterium]